jgi:disulfide bond formation protein DsbB
MVSTVSKVLSLLTVGTQAIIIFGLIHILFFRKKNKNPIIRFFYQNGLKLAFLVALVATLGSLFYSEVAGFEPCKLCWFQRIFMYPLAVLLGLATIKRDDRFTFYPAALAIIGGAISLYHNLIYNGLVIESSRSIIQCQPLGVGISCAREYVLEFGYITIPLMALTAFSLILLLLAAQRHFNLTAKK